MSQAPRPGPWHPWRKWFHLGPGKAPHPRRVILAPEDSLILTNGHQEAQEAPQEAVQDHPEHILCFPSSLLDDSLQFSPGRFRGLRSDAVETIGRLFPSGINAVDFRLFLGRSDPLERDDSIKQVVAVAVPWHPLTRQVWCFRRGGSEGRLSGKLSCLPGGHVAIEDAYPGLTDVSPDNLLTLPRLDPLEVTFRAVIRENGEELEQWQDNFKKHHGDTKLLIAGCVNDDASEHPVDRCHFGVVYLFQVSKLTVPEMQFAKSAQSSGKAIGWLPVTKLLDDPPIPVETWSLHVARHLAEHSIVRRSN